MFVGSSLNGQFVVASVRKHFCRPVSRRSNGNTILTLFDDIRKRRPTCTILISLFITRHIHRNIFRDIVKSIVTLTLRRCFCFHSNRGKGSATIKSIITYTCYTVADSDRCQTGAITEGIVSNTRYAVGNSN